MKIKILLLFCLLSIFFLASGPTKLKTVRQAPQYLSTNSSLVEDTCPEHNILKQFSCSKKNKENFFCFDVYMVQGSPIDTERYTLLEEKLTLEKQTPEPLCPIETLTCEHFLRDLKYNLDFSWFIANYPSSSFPECAETYSCVRISCLKPSPSSNSSAPNSQRLSCVFKKNQFFFLGSQISCQAQ